MDSVSETDLALFKNLIAVQDAGAEAIKTPLLRGEAKRQRPTNNHAPRLDSIAEEAGEEGPGGEEEGYAEEEEEEEVLMSDDDAEEKSKGRMDREARRIMRKTALPPEDFTEADMEAENKNPRLRREKQEILFRLLRTYPEESQGGQWSMRVPLFELKYELMRRESHREEVDTLYLMKQALSALLQGTEMLNKRFGWLELDGWSESVTRDMSRYDRCLQSLYHMYFKRRQPNPIMDMLFLIFGSMIMWHLKKKFLKAPAAPAAPTAPTPTAASDIRPPPASGAPPQRPVAGGGGIDLGSVLKLFANRR